MMPRSVAIGLDIGTGGARAVALDFSGSVVASGRADFSGGMTRTDGPKIEQSAEAWTQAAQAALQKLSASIPADAEITGIAVDATSGTFLLADEHNQPLTPGLMYNDMRGTAEGAASADALRSVLKPYGVEIAPAFALPKILHLARHEPAVFKRCRRIIHQTDWIVGMLCWRYDVTDISTALKTGADPGTLTWPRRIETELGIPLALLPRIVLPGVMIGKVTTEAAAMTGIPAGVPVISGCTDGTAGCLASGASKAGDLNTTLGTTLVFKAISPTPLIDPDGALYNHRHPAGGFLPGAACSAGAEWVAKYFEKGELDELSNQVGNSLPSGQIAYPLAKTGERFPFSSDTAKGFGLDTIEDPVTRLAAGMEGIAFLERMGIEKLERLGLPISDRVFATGGAASNRTWLRIRASVNGRSYVVSENPECAAGAAILAASASIGDCGKAIRAMVRIAQQIEPDARLADQYDRQYQRFCDALRERGYL